MTQDTALMAHLLRRAGFGATKDELEQYVAKGYEATVEELIHPELAPQLDEDVIRRYHVDQNSLMLIESCQAYWMYRMINTKRPLEEKVALFWHGLFATAYGKLNHAKAVVNQTNTFRRQGLGSFANLLRELSRDPAMIFWLDNKDNHKDAPNENFGRELLELFSMGIGTYTEEAALHYDPEAELQPFPTIGAVGMAVTSAMDFWVSAVTARRRAPTKRVRTKNTGVVATATKVNCHDKINMAMMVLASVAVMFAFKGIKIRK